jgi:hypothetical protein
VIMLAYLCRALRNFGAYQVPELEQEQVLQEQAGPMMTVVLIDELN